MELSKLAKQVKRGNRLALSKGITIVENDRKDAARLLSELETPGRAFVLGITGPPGTGKSSLVDRLIGTYRGKGLKVGVIAVDPTSPITGGALLGDRVRMVSHSEDEAVFIRSMASRGWSGGLSRAASQAIQLMDAAGFDVILLETVGIGQADIDVVGVSHAVLVVLMPGLGDDVQVSKAGLMEVGDVYVVNKSDLEGADLMVVSLLGLVRGLKSRSPAVVKVSALTGDGLDRLDTAVESIRSKFVQGDPELRLRSLRSMIIETARGNAMERLGRIPNATVEKLAREVLAGKLTVDQAAARIGG
ncbi:MAG: methylmalonyl Co-A mutase-associated GTPase MeaB [Candidatus Gagatemarchaeaceae archaeon]